MYNNTLIGYYRDGVPVYGFCKDSSGAMFTSCYKLNAGATTTTVATVSGTYTVASSNSDYTFSADSNCNLDEANGLFDLFVRFLKKKSSIAGAVHPTTGQYSYFMTTDYPWTPIKFAGDQVIIKRSFLLNVNKLPTTAFIVGSGQLL